jgi:MoxR-like ATPase
LKDDGRVLLARPGFNIIATANIRDRGVHEMSSALKRRFNFETVAPIRDLKMEVELVRRECERLLQDAAAPVDARADAIEVLVTAFHDLREGVTAEGTQVEKPSAVMSTAEAVSVAFAAGLDAFYYGQKKLTPAVIARHLASAALKDNADDIKKLRHYFDTVVQKRSDKGGPWAELYKARKEIG